MYKGFTLCIFLIIGYINTLPQSSNRPQIISDSFGNTYIAGNFQNESLNFGEFHLKNSGKSDIYFAKYDPKGKILWANSIGSGGNEKFRSINMDASGRVSISVFSSSKEIELNGLTLKNNSGEMIFNALFSGTGNFLNSEIVSRKNFVQHLKTSGTDTMVELLSPETGDNWKVGTKAAVTWTSENVNSVIIELSTDNGNSWDEIFISDLFDYGNEFRLIVPNTPSNSCLIKVSDYYNPGVSDTSGLFSISGELFWENKQTDFSSVLMNSFISNSSIWMAGLDGLIKTTDDGESWNSYLSGFGLLDIFFLNDTVGWTVGLSGAVFKTINGGDDWVQQDSIINSYLVDIFFSDDTTGRMIGGNNFLKTTNGGESWDVQQPTEHILMTMFFINKEEGWIAGNEGVILKTTNAGTSWDYQQLNGTDYGTLTSIYFVNEDTGFASGSGLDVEGGVILKTTDGGENWNLNHHGYNHFIFSVSFIGTDSGWACGDEGIMFNTADGGENWELQGTGTLDDLLAVNIKSLSAGWTIGNNGVILKYHQDPIDPPIPVELFSFNAINSDNEVKLNWITASEVNNKGFEIEKKEAAETEYYKWTGIGFVQGKGTTSESQFYSFVDKNIKHGTFLYRLKQIDYDGSFDYSGTVEVTVGSGYYFRLGQNYPNPFNPSTVINFSLRENVHVMLKVFDVLGGEITTLVNEEKPAGDYKINFNAANFPSGIYFYVLKAGNFSETKKMLLLK